MYTIDLLKGEGIPVKSKPLHIIRSSIPFSVLVIAAVALAGSYVSNQVIIHQLHTKLVSYTEDAEFVEVAHFIQENQQQQNTIQGILTEVSQSVFYHRQWTPVLVEVIETLPETLILNHLAVQRQSLRQREQNAEGKPVDVTWYQYTLEIGTESNQGLEANAIIQEFVHSLRTSDFLASQIDEMTVVSKQNEDNDSDNNMRYQIDCVFKRAR